MNPNMKKLDANKLRDIIELNFDARQYFYSKADENLLDWLWANGFLDALNQKPQDITRYSYSTPELNYLVRMAEKSPAKVVDIMTTIQSSAESYNPEVIDRFCWIASILPADQVARIAIKIRDENWVKLLGGFNHWGFEYEKMFEKLSEAKDYGTMIIIAEALLSIRTKEDISKTTNGYSTDNPFYFNELSYTKVFEHLAKVDQAHYEQVLKLLVKVMTKIIEVSSDKRPDDIFSVGEVFYLFDVDFFTLEANQEEHLSYRDDVRELANSIKLFVDRLIKENCSNGDEVRRIYNAYIEGLPNSRSMYRFRLYVFSLCPKIFKNEIKTTFFAIFNFKKPWDLISGAEYERLIQSSFSVLNSQDQREFVSKIFDLFTKEDGYKFAGHDILSAAFPMLTEEEKKKAEDMFGKLNDHYEPEPSIRRGYAGVVQPQAPGNDEEWKKPVSELVSKLKAEWSAAELRKNYPEIDFLRPVDADGVGDRIRSEMGKRTSEFFECARLFFDRESLEAHYTYSYLRGVYDLLRENKMPEASDLTPVIDLMDDIRKSGQQKSFDGGRVKDGHRWLAYWDAVHNSMADVLKQLLVRNHDDLFIDFKALRQQLLDINAYLLAYHDPSAREEQAETAKIKRRIPGTNPEEYEASDPYTTAINSVRGRAFESFAAFVFHDGKLLETEGKKIADDVKKLYEKVLSDEETQSIMFMFGHYIPTFYYRDIDWIHGLLPKIFTDDLAKIDLYLAAWEGYVSSNLYREIFADPEFQKLYARAIGVSPDQYTKRRYFRKLDEGLATHLALAFMHYEDFGFDNPLFMAFWKKPVTERQGEFIGFIGSGYISGEVRGASELLKDSKIIDKLKAFWDWVLTNCSDPDALARFGFWLKKDKRLFDYVWLAQHVKATMQKTSGDIDWDYGLMTSITELAKAAPEDTLDVLRLLVLEHGVRGNNASRSMLYVHDEWLEAFSILYSNPKTKSGTHSLIDDLIREGGSSYWKLKEIIK